MAAFELLAGAHADRLFAVLLRLLGDRAAAADVAQEVMLRAWRGIGRFRGNSSFFTWLYRIAVNEARRSLARRARQPATTAVDDAVALPARLPTSPNSRPSGPSCAGRSARRWPACRRASGSRSCCATSRACPPGMRPRSPASARRRLRAGCTRGG